MKLGKCFEGGISPVTFGFLLDDDLGIEGATAAVVARWIHASTTDCTFAVGLTHAAIRKECCELKQASMSM